MPRDIGTGLYHYPDGTPGNPAQTIFSTRYNTFINDLANTMNQKLPINMGGTGADSATTARDNLDAERAGAQVTDYDMHVFEAGSFWSAVGATAAPNSAARFVGTCIITGDGTNDTYIYVTPPGTATTTYTRRKNAGLWGAWMLQPANAADLDAAYVNVSGDTMAGNLTISNAGPVITLNASTTPGQNVLFGDKVGLHRWAILLGDATAEGGTQTGSNFQILRYDNTGNFISGTPVSIDRLSGIVIFGSAIEVRAGGILNHSTVNRINFDWIGGDIGLNYKIDGSANVKLWSTVNSPAAGISNGYQKLASGIIHQWGSVAGTGGLTTVVITFPVAFPNACLNVIATGSGDLPATASISVNVHSYTTSQVAIQLRFANNGGIVGIASQGFQWHVVGW